MALLSLKTKPIARPSQQNTYRYENGQHTKRQGIQSHFTMYIFSQTFKTDMEILREAKTLEFHVAL